MNSLLDLFKSPSKNTNNNSYSLSSSMDTMVQSKSLNSSPSFTSSTPPSLNSSAESAFTRTPTQSIDIPGAANKETSYYRMLQVEACSW